jgi:hypothetical protein
LASIQKKNILFWNYCGNWNTILHKWCLEVTLYKNPISLWIRMDKKHGRYRHSCFWLANVKKSFPLKLLCQLKPNFAGMVFGKSPVYKILILLQWDKTWLPIRQLLFLIVTFNKHIELSPINFYSIWKKHLSSCSSIWK